MHSRQLFSLQKEECGIKMIYFKKAKYLCLFFIAATTATLSSCKEGSNKLPISVVKTQRTTEAHPEIVISKPKETSLKEVEKDTYKEITQSQKESACKARPKGIALVKVKSSVNGLHPPPSSGQAERFIQAYILKQIRH